MDAPTPPTKPPVTVDTRVSQYVRLRDHIKALDDAHKKKMEPLRETLEQLNSDLLARLDQAGAESVKTEHGTVYKTAKKSASIADKSAFWAWVVATGDWDLLDYKANPTAVEDFIAKRAAEYEADPTKPKPAPPPGVNFSKAFVVGVRRA